MKKIKMLVALGTATKGYAAEVWYDVEDELADSFIRAGHAIEIKPKKETQDKQTSPVKAEKKQSTEKADKLTSEKM